MSIKDFRTAVRRAIKDDVPAVIEVPIDPEEIGLTLFETGILWDDLRDSQRLARTVERLRRQQIVRRDLYYRLRVVNNDNSFQYSEVLNVIPNISSISRSWGSIKALFR